MDYYEILGIQKNASAEEIKSAYRKLAMKHHPDRGGDGDYFAKINTAYETLKDPAKRQEYDNPQPQWSHFNNQGSVFEDLFRTHFGRGFAPPGVHRNKDIRIQVNMTLEEILHGKELTATYNTLKKETRSINISIPAGVRQGEAIRYRGLGDDSHEGIPPGDLLVLVRELPHARFKRKDINVELTLDISVLELIIGKECVIKTLDGSAVNVKIPAGATTQAILSITGHGLFDPRTRTKGNMHIRLNGIVPKISNEKILKKVKKLNDEINNCS